MTNKWNRLLSKPIGRRAFGVGAGATLLTTVTPFNILKAQSKALKIGVLLPKSSYQAQIGQSCQRGVDIAMPLLKELGYTQDIQIVSADTETNVDVARSRAERLIGEGCHVLIGAFDSGQTAAIAQVTEQRGVPFVINIGSQPQITESGYMWVVRNFPTTPQLIQRGLLRMKDLFAATGFSPKTAVYMHVNDTFGMAVSGAINKMLPGMDFPFKILEEVSYDPAAKDLSLEVAKAKAKQPDLLLVTTRINDVILLVRELVKQRFSPAGIISPGSPGMYEAGFFSALGKYSDYCISNVPWIKPQNDITKRTVAEFIKKFPNESVDGNIFNVGFTFEALWIAADAHKRAGTANPTELMAALKATKIDTHVMAGDPIQFSPNGQNNGIPSLCLQNKDGRAHVVLPKDAAVGTPVLPIPAWDKRA